MRGRQAGDRIGPVALLCLGLLSAALLAAAPALGYFTTTGRGAVAVAVGSLTAPAISSAEAATGGTVTLTWAESEAPGAVAYYVTRDGGAPGGDCPTAAEPQDGVDGCTDDGLEPGTYTYRIVARYRSWMATGEPASARVTVGPADHFVLQASSRTPKAGAADKLTITAEDAADSTVTTYAGSHDLTFAGASASPGGNLPTVGDDDGTAVVFGEPTAIDFTDGVARVDSGRNGVMRLYDAGAATISVGDGSIGSEPDPTVAVAAAGMSGLALSAATATPVAGATDPLAVTATDAYGNLATSYKGSHNLVYSGASPSPSGDAPTVTNSSGTVIAFGSSTKTRFTTGVATTSGSENGAMVLYRAAAAAAITVTEGTKSGTASAPITVTAGPAAAASLSLAAATSTPVAGASDDLTATALDPYGNVATSYTGSHNITFSGLEPSPGGTAATVTNSSGAAVAVGSATALGFASGVATVSSTRNGVLEATRTGAATLAATDGMISTGTGLALTVSAGTAEKLAWSGATVSAGTLGSSCLFICAVTGLGNGGTFVAKVAVTDALGNVVSDLGGGHPVSVTATSGSTVTGGALTIASSGLAESTATFTYTAPAHGNYSNTITAARSAGTNYTSATATASR
jgi:hypothetical protein